MCTILILKIQHLLYFCFCISLVKVKSTRCYSDAVVDWRRTGLLVRIFFFYLRLSFIFPLLSSHSSMRLSIVWCHSFFFEKWSLFFYESFHTMLFSPLFTFFIIIYSLQTGFCSASNRRCFWAGIISCTVTALVKEVGAQHECSANRITNIVCSNDVHIFVGLRINIRQKDVYMEGFNITLWRQGYSENYSTVTFRKDDNRYNKFYNFVFDLYVVRLLVFWRNVLNVSNFLYKINIK